MPRHAQGAPSCRARMERADITTTDSFARASQRRSGGNNASQPPLASLVDMYNALALPDNAELALPGAQLPDSFTTCPKVQRTRFLPPAAPAAAAAAAVVTAAQPAGQVCAWMEHEPSVLHQAGHGACINMTVASSMLLLCPSEHYLQIHSFLREASAHAACSRLLRPHSSCTAYAHA